MGARRELKQALEAYRGRKIDVQQLKDQAKAIRKKFGCCKKKRV
jgi:5-methyltetrahydropteroyltriglutamate--homocysteine methyltransferase